MDATERSLTGQEQGFSDLCGVFDRVLDLQASEIILNPLESCDSGG